MLECLKKNKWILLTNLFIIISYVFIATKPELFGIDDIMANSYIYNPQFTFLESINWIIQRAWKWNTRIGEILYFIIGCFPRWVYFILNSICLIIFLNLIFIYIHGAKFKTYIHNYKYIFNLLFCYIITLTIYPAFSETMIWMGGCFNHLWDTTIVLLVGVPFRLILDGKDIVQKKYLFFILCFMAGFSTEHIIPWLLAYMSIITIITYIKRQKFNWCLTAILIVLISFIYMYYLNSTTIRVNFFENLEWALETKRKMLFYIINDYRYIIYLIIFLIIIAILKNILITKTKQFYKQLFLPTIHLLLSFISIAVIYLAPYFVMRTTILMFFFMQVLILSLMDHIISSKMISKLLSIVSFIFMIYLSFKLRWFYADFNKFNKYRYNFIKKQVLNNEAIIKCPLYDNKYNIFFPSRLVSYECFYCDPTYIQYLFNDDNLKLLNIYDSIR